MRGRLWAVAALPLVAGCGLRPHAVVCPDDLKGSYVSVRLDTHAGTAYRLCAAGVCQTLGSDESATEKGDSLLVLIPGTTGPVKVPVHLTITPKGRRPTPSVDARTKVTLRTNGPTECGPATYWGHLAYTPAGGLVAVDD
jgi:hypothetical protein